jgi:hypothetical protein
MSNPTPEQRAHRRFRNWALVLVATPVVVILIWVNVAANAERQKEEETDKWCATVSQNSPEAVGCADRELLKQLAPKPHP